MLGAAKVMHKEELRERERDGDGRAPTQAVCDILYRVDRDCLQSAVNKVLNKLMRYEDENKHEREVSKHDSTSYLQLLLARSSAIECTCRSATCAAPSSIPQRDRASYVMNARGRTLHRYSNRDIGANRAAQDGWGCPSSFLQLCTHASALWTCIRSTPRVTPWWYIVTCMWHFLRSHTPNNAPLSLSRCRFHRSGARAARRSHGLWRAGEEPCGDWGWTFVLNKQSSAAKDARRYRFDAAYVAGKGRLISAASAVRPIYLPAKRRGAHKLKTSKYRVQKPNL